MEDFRDIGKYISMIQRIKNNYVARELSAYQIGCGQQFFLLQISEHPGISLQRLAELGYYDKATSTRAVHKLEVEGYVRTEMDTVDKRVRKIYVTQKAEPVISKTKEILDRWCLGVLEGIPPDEQRQAKRLLEKMAGNARICMEQNRRKD